MKPLDASKLGHVQRACYETLCDHGYWSRYSGWTWGPTTHSTRKMLDTLAKRGFATISRTPRGHRVYHPVLEEE